MEISQNIVVFSEYMNFTYFRLSLTKNGSAFPHGNHEDGYQLVLFHSKSIVPNHDETKPREISSYKFAIPHTVDIKSCQMFEYFFVVFRPCLPKIYRL